MVGFNEVELFNNQITDDVMPVLIFSFFCNPTLKRITCAYNYMRNSFTRTLSKMVSLQPEKLTELNCMGSITHADHIDPVIRILPESKQLNLLNIAGCSLTQTSCR